MTERFWSSNEVFSTRCFPYRGTLCQHHGNTFFAFTRPEMQLTLSCDQFTTIENGAGRLNGEEEDFFKWIQQKNKTSIAWQQTPSNADFVCCQTFCTCLQSQCLVSKDNGITRVTAHVLQMQMVIVLCRNSRNIACVLWKTRMEMQSRFVSVTF